MSAADSLHSKQFPGVSKNEVHGQLPMFMTGREIIRATVPGDSDGQHGRMWKEKNEDNKIAHKRADENFTGGIHTPVKISDRPWKGDTKPTLYDGHHRVIHEAINAPHRLLPVSHARHWSDT